MDEDFLERASAYERDRIELAIAAARRKEIAPSNFDGACDCGDNVPLERLRLGYHRCITCQQRLEKGQPKR